MTVPPFEELTVSAPASSANLGSGFDAVGVAFELRMEARVRVLAAGEAPSWRYGGPCAPTHGGLRGCVERGIARIAPDAPPLAVELDNAIPLGAGLGSSAAAIAIGVAIGARLVARAPDDAALARAVAELEGHPDNALAAWYGGAVVATLGDDGVHAARLAAPPVEAVVAIPRLELATEHARALLPDRYSRADAVFNVQRAALLGAALATGDVALLGAAMRDRLHQPYRAPLLPGLEAVLALDDPALLAIALSGAGPSVLAFARAEPVRIGERMIEAFARAGVAATARVLAFAPRGVVVTADAPAAR